MISAKNNGMPNFTVATFASLHALWYNNYKAMEILYRKYGIFAIAISAKFV